MVLQAQMPKYSSYVDRHDAWGWKEKVAVWPPMQRNGIRFWDRISVIIINIPNYLNSTSEKTILVPAILFSSTQLLTAYNPFRDIIDKPEVANELVAVFVSQYTQLSKIKVHIAEIICGRQIVYMPDDKVEHWHGADKKHSPVHDLMVLRVNEEFSVTGFSNLFRYDGRLYNNGEGSGFNGPVCTYLADVHEKLGVDAMIYSLGYRTKKEMTDFNYTHPYKITSVENSLVNCEEWMPRRWGYFICLNNEHNYQGVGSGAMLYSNNKLFGVGSFALFLKNSSILVFTDIRPYRKLLFRTCLDEEFED
uniref:Peptidase S1 domain-containing protein n=1 Tax=Heliothis virescens TaxID=7102 RepID=A0A2A4K713_HELVI